MSWIQETLDLFGMDEALELNDLPTYIDYTDAPEETVALFDSIEKELDNVSGVGDFSD